MVMNGETIRNGAPSVCPECATELALEVHLSGGGYYVGTWCQCGPYSRESEYYSTREQAQSALDNDLVAWRFPKYHKVQVSGTIWVRDNIPIDAFLGDHTIECVLSNNCDGYSNCEPALLTIEHTRL